MPDYVRIIIACVTALVAVVSFVLVIINVKKKREPCGSLSVRLIS